VEPTRAEIIAEIVRPRTFDEFMEEYDLEREEAGA
jgi:hypothetical protein